MKQFQVHLNSIDSVKKFVALAEGHNCEIDVTSGRYIVDGKSMLGLFSLDLSQRVGVDYYGEDADGDRFIKQLSAVLGADHVEG
jgi:phosphotransferase system HPr-like phosphotransfer protein